GQQSLSQETLAFGRQALERSLMPSDLRFGHYLWPVLAQVASGESAQSALQTAQVAALDNVTRAEAMRDSLQVIVPTVIPPSADAAQAVSIRFGLYTGRTDLPERSQWEAAIENFVASDSSIEQIELNFVPPVAGYPDEIVRNDCVFGYYFDEYPDEQLLVLDPLLDADPTFDPADVVGDAMLDVQREGRTFALPVGIMPTVLLYQRALFDQAGVPEPDGTWNVDQFTDALQQLSSVTDGAPLFFNLNYSTPWELLMAAYGAVPVDYNTTPSTLHLTDPEVIAAVRQVLDLAKAGYIHYQPMSTFFGSGASPDYAPALLNEQLSDVNEGEMEAYGLVTFPVGTQTTPVSFYSTSAFIFASAPHPEACYRWLREITRHPELSQAMPVYHSVIQAPTTQAIYGDTGVVAFQRFAEMMEAPDHVFIRSFGLGVGESMFMNRAFDRYVLEDADLEAELALAQTLTETYRACAAPEDSDVLDCLLATDPTIRENIPARILGNR
ncbi:MAG: extracellular solute-binding protein, partial [Anaerolineae bacterium]|nr:extracellular solute-binding protein [Anaerolineae bacterium]